MRAFGEMSLGFNPNSWLKGHWNRCSLPGAWFLEKDSCNGLLLCRTLLGQLYAYNPSITNVFKLLPEPDNAKCYRDSLNGGFKMAFDPTKSPHYKVIYYETVKREIVEPDMDDMDDMIKQIHTFSSETGNWSLCGHQFPEHYFQNFKKGVYWNDAIYWPIGYFGYLGKIFKLDIMNEHPVLTALPTPFIVDLKVDNVYRLFESRDCLLLLGLNKACSRHFTIYEKRNVYSEWSLKYIVNLDDIIKPFPRRWMECLCVYCIVLGEREEDSFLVMELDSQHNL
nr:hypothetical protein [Tanacetum cinerariifolium]